MLMPKQAADDDETVLGSAFIMLTQRGHDKRLRLSPTDPLDAQYQLKYWPTVV